MRTPEHVKRVSNEPVRDIQLREDPAALPEQHRTLREQHRQRLELEEVLVLIRWHRDRLRRYCRRYRALTKGEREHG